MPTVAKFLESLDRDKKVRDRRLEEAQKQPQAGDAVPHKEIETKDKALRTVTDPTTETEVQIDDVNKEFMQHAKDPMVHNIKCTV